MHCSGGVVLLLEAAGLTVRYDGIEALRNVSFHVEQGEMVALIGPNGAGKSTALKAVSGTLDQAGGRICQGTISLHGELITHLRTDQLVRRGVCLVPEGRRVFTSLTVMENLEMGAYTLTTKGSARPRIEEVLELFPLLRDRTKHRAGSLSAGEQQMLALARALILHPKLLMADEPSVGLSPRVADAVFEKLVELNRGGASILFVEQNVRRALSVCQRAYLMVSGVVAAEGSSEALSNSQPVREAFLGG